MRKNKNKKATKLNNVKDTINKRKKRQAKKLNKKLNQKLKRKEKEIKVVEEFEEIGEITEIVEPKQDFKQKLKVETTGQFRGLIQNREKRLEVEAREEEEQINLIKVIEKLQKEKEMEI